MPGPFISDVAFLGAGSGSNSPNDDFESYTDLASLNGLNGGSNWGGAYVARSNLTGVQYFDTAESYADGAALAGLNEGTFGGSYVTRTNDIISSTKIAHWKADSFSLSDGTAIGGTGNEWADQSGNSRDATQSTSGSRPLFKTNIFGSLPSIRFDGTDDFLTFTSVTLTGDFTIIAVTKNVTTDCMLLGNSTINNQVRLFQSGANVLSMYDNSNNPVSGTFTNAASGTRMSVFRRSGTAAGFYENNGSDHSSGTLSGSMKLEWIGKYISSILFLNADLGELEVYNVALTVGQIQDRYSSYYSPKYGI